MHLSRILLLSLALVFSTLGVAWAYTAEDGVKGHISNLTAIRAVADLCQNKEKSEDARAFADALKRAGLENGILTKTGVRRFEKAMDVHYEKMHSLYSDHVPDQCESALGNIERIKEIYDLTGVGADQYEAVIAKVLSSEKNYEDRLEYSHTFHPANEETQEAVDEAREKHANIVRKNENTRKTFNIIILITLVLLVVYVICERLQDPSQGFRLPRIKHSARLWLAVFLGIRAFLDFTLGIVEDSAFNFVIGGLGAFALLFLRLKSKRAFYIYSSIYLLIRGGLSLYVYLRTIPPWGYSKLDVIMALPLDTYPSLMITFVLPIGFGLFAMWRIFGDGRT